MAIESRSVKVLQRSLRNQRLSRMNSRTLRTATAAATKCRLLSTWASRWLLKARPKQQSASRLQVLLWLSPRASPRYCPKPQRETTMTWPQWKQFSTWVVILWLWMINDYYVYNTRWYLMPPGRSKRTMARFHCTRHGWSGLLDFRRADVDYVDMRDSKYIGDPKYMVRH